MVKYYTYLISYQVTLYTGAVVTSETLFKMEAGECVEDSEFYGSIQKNAFKDADNKYGGVSRVTILNIINLTKLKPVMEV